MSRNAQHTAIGILMFAVGLTLALTTGDVDTPVIALSKVGVVLTVLGVIEAGVGLAGMLRSSERDTTELNG